MTKVATSNERVNIELSKKEKSFKEKSFRIEKFGMKWLMTNLAVQCPDTVSLLWSCFEEDPNTVCMTPIETSPMVSR